MHAIYRIPLLALLSGGGKAQRRAGC